MKAYEKMWKGDKYELCKLVLTEQNNNKHSASLGIQ